MKLLIAGNLANYGYFLTKKIREYGIDAHLLMEKHPLDTNNPKHFDDNLSDFPEWIEFWDNKSHNWKYQIIKTMRKFDLIQSSTELPIFSLFSGKPNISFATGSDIIELAHKNTIKGIMLRWAYKKSKIVIFPGLYMYDSIKKLKIKNSLFMPPLWDYSKFLSLTDKKNDSEFTIFHPTSHIWYQKGNDIFIRAFAKFAKKYPNAHLIMIKRGIDFDKSKSILKKNDVLKNVTIIEDAISQNQINEYYNMADVIVDQFVLGSTGLIGQEAMSCKKPLIQYINKELHEIFYPEIPPVLNSITEKQIYDNLVELIEDPKIRKQIGIKSREWLLKYHNPEKIMKKYLYLYDAVHMKIKYKKIIDELNSM